MSAAAFIPGVPSRLPVVHSAIVGRASFAATTPGELMSKQTELHTQLVDKLRERAQEFSTVTSEIQSKLSQIGNEFAAKAVPARKAA